MLSSGCENTFKPRQILNEGNEWTYLCIDTTQCHIEYDDWSSFAFYHIQKVQGDTMKSGIVYKKVYNYITPYEFGDYLPENIVLPEYYCYREDEGKLYKESMLVLDMTLQTGSKITDFENRDITATVIFEGKNWLEYKYLTVYVDGIEENWIDGCGSDICGINERNDINLSGFFIDAQV